MGAIKPRALIHGLLSYYVKPAGGEIRLKALVQLGEELGITGSTMRVMAARMREEGWLTVRREGRESIYGLTSMCDRMLEEGRRRVFREEPAPWSRTWAMVIYSVPESDRPTREQLRKDLSWLDFGPLAPATWVSPHAHLDDVANVGAALPKARLELVNMITPDLASDRSIAARCWELDELNADYQTFIRSCRQQLPAYRNKHVHGADALAARTLILRQFRTLRLRDPNLPVELQPAGWVGNQANALFLECNQLLEGPATEHFRDVVHQ